MRKGPLGERRPPNLIGATLRVARISVGDRPDDRQNDERRSAAADLERLEARRAPRS